MTRLQALGEIIAIFIGATMCGAGLMWLIPNMEPNVGTFFGAFIATWFVSWRAWKVLLSRPEREGEEDLRSELMRNPLED